MYKLALMASMLVSVASWPQMFETKAFKVGIEYQGSLPMEGGSDRYRHRNNLDPFYITVTANVKNGYVITYLQVSTIIDKNGDVEFNVIQGETGSKKMVFQLISNQTDFLSYNYIVYGIKEEEYKKLNNIITLHLRNYGEKVFNDCFMILLFSIILRCILW